MAVARNPQETSLPRAYLLGLPKSQPVEQEEREIPLGEKELFPWVNNAAYSSFHLDLASDAESTESAGSPVEHGEDEPAKGELQADEYKQRFQNTTQEWLESYKRQRKIKVVRIGKKRPFGYTTAIKKDVMLRLAENGKFGVFMDLFRSPKNGDSAVPARSGAKELTLDHERKETILTPDMIREYIIGATEMFDHIHFLCETVRASGERPIVLIPSRGAMPLLTAGRVGYEETMKAQGRPSELGKVESRFYPPGFFQYLSANYMRESSNPDPMSEVVIFPYTADISDERNDANDDDRAQSNLIRYSAVRSTEGILRGQPNEDLVWSLTLTQSILAPLNVQNEFGNYQFSPERYVASLIELTQKQNARNHNGERTHLILVDTVLSGTASSQILRHCADLGIPVTPVLALDTSVHGARTLRQRRQKHQPLDQATLMQHTGIHRNKLNAIMEAVIEVQQKSGSAMINPDYSDIFCVFPLISEDRRPLLGINAVSVHLDPEVESKFFPNRTPQSCIWTMSPETHPEFHTLLQMAYSTAHNANDAALQDLANRMATLDAFDSRASVTPELIKRLVKREYWPERFEVSNSGIIRLFLSAEQSKRLMAQYQANLK